LPLISVKVKVLYVIWKKGTMEADLDSLRKALHYKDESHLRRLIPSLVAEGLLESRKRQGKPDLWKVTREGQVTIRFLTLPILAYALMTAFGVATLITGVASLEYKLPLLPSGEIGVGLTILIFGVFLWIMHRNLEKEILRVEGQDDSEEGQAVPG
jgi:hypothetical protein